jgi:hypothetical protein
MSTVRTLASAWETPSAPARRSSTGFHAAPPVTIEKRPARDADPSMQDSARPITGNGGIGIDQQQCRHEGFMG